MTLGQSKTIEDEISGNLIPLTSKWIPLDNFFVGKFQVERVSFRKMFKEESDVSPLSMEVAKPFVRFCQNAYSYHLRTHYRHWVLHALENILALYLWGVPIVSRGPRWV